VSKKESWSSVKSNTNIPNIFLWNVVPYDGRQRWSKFVNIAVGIGCVFKIVDERIQQGTDKSTGWQGNSHLG